MEQEEKKEKEENKMAEKLKKKILWKKIFENQS